MHRHALHSQMEKIDDLNNDEKARGKTAAVGIRLNPRLASLGPRSNLASQSNVQRRGISQNYYPEDNTDGRDITTAATNNFMSKSGFTHYPG